MLSVTAVDSTVSCAPKAVPSSVIFFTSPEQLGNDARKRPKKHQQAKQIDDFGGTHEITGSGTEDMTQKSKPTQMTAMTQSPTVIW